MMAKQLNLLPGTRRKNLKREAILLSIYRFGTSVVVGLVLLTVAGLSAAILMWLLSLIRVPAAGAELAAAIQEYQQVRDELVGQNLVLAELARIDDERLLWSEKIGQLFSRLPAAGTISQLEIETAEMTITLQGTAETRTSLVAFEQRLRELPGLKELVAPSENLLRRLNPDYEFIITIGEEKSDG